MAQQQYWRFLERKRELEQELEQRQRELRHLRRLVLLSHLLIAALVALLILFRR
jgi:hypothetical protein